jgi:hypothetical protein
MNDWTFEYYPGESEEELLFETRRSRRRPPARPPRRPVRRPRPPVRLRPPARFIFDQPRPEPEQEPVSPGQPAGPESDSRSFTALLVFRRNLSRQELNRVLRALDARGLNEE